MKRKGVLAQSYYRIPFLLLALWLLCILGCHSIDSSIICRILFHITLFLSLSLSFPTQALDKSVPIFGKQFYSDTVPENIELHSPLSVQIQANSPLSRKLIYSIVKGNDLEVFAVDFNTGMIKNLLPLCSSLLLLHVLYRQTFYFISFGFCPYTSPAQQTNFPDI